MTENLCANNIMTSPVLVFREIESVGRIYDILSTNNFHGFPVVEDYNPNEPDQETFGHLKGLILRHQLVTLIKKRKFFPGTPDLSQDDFRETYPHYLDIGDVEIRPEWREYELDLRPYMNLSPYSLNENSNLPRIFRLFRGLGLRHIVIVDMRNRVIGIVTRIDIAKFKTHIGFKNATIKQLNIVM